ncbi:MAG TPA: MerC domain-containing protein [Panacibacter sp.]|nr:MerC domain-containing protein [Panacibacter sp.]HNP44637.1 MerC domain-containing protein [Panacibacter sp.]
MKLNINWDALGIATSVVCAIHCAVLPLIISSLPLFGINIVDNLAFELFMILLTALIGVWSLYHGWKNQHHNIVPFTLFLIGLVLLSAKQVWHEKQVIFLVPAVLLIVGAHFINFRLSRVADHVHDKNCDHQ